MIILIVCILSPYLARATSKPTNEDFKRLILEATNSSDIDEFLELHPSFKERFLWLSEWQRSELERISPLTAERILFHWMSLTPSDINQLYESEALWRYYFPFQKILSISIVWGVASASAFGIIYRFSPQLSAYNLHYSHGGNIFLSALIGLALASFPNNLMPSIDRISIRKLHREIDFELSPRARQNLPALRSLILACAKGHPNPSPAPEFDEETH